MALSKCPKCEKGFFEIKVVEPMGASHKQCFVQCSACGTPIGVIGFNNPAVMIDGLGETIAKIEQRISRIEGALHTINHNLTVIDNKISR